MRLYIAAALLYVQAGVLVALGAPWAAVACAALGLVPIVFMSALEASEAFTAAEEVNEGVETLEALQKQVEALRVQVESLKRSQALNSLVG